MKASTSAMLAAYCALVATSGQLPGTEPRVIQAHEGSIYDLEFNRNTGTIVSAAHDNCIVIWDLESGQEQDRLNCPARCIAISEDGKLLAARLSYSRVQVWELSSSKLRSEFVIDDKRVGPIAFTRDGAFLVAAGRKVWLLNLDSREIQMIDVPAEEISGLRVLSNDLVAAFTEKAQIYFCDLSTRKEVIERRVDIFGELQQFRAFKSGKLRIEFAVLSSDASQCALAMSNEQIHIWDVVHNARIVDTTLNGHDSQVYSMAISQDGKLLCSSSPDSVHFEFSFGRKRPLKIDYDREKHQSMRLWSLETSKLLAELDSGESVANCIRFSSDSKLLACGNRDGEIRIWNLSGVLPSAMAAE